MIIHISDTESCVTLYRSKFFNHLNEIGYSRFSFVNQEETVTLLIRHVYPTKLKAEMHNILHNKKALKKEVWKFIVKITSEAVHYQAFSLHKQNYIDTTDENRQKTLKPPTLYMQATPRKENPP